MSEDDARAALAHRAAQGRRKRLRKALAKGRKPVPAVHPDEKRDCSLCGNSFGLITDRGVCCRRWPSLPAARECLTSSGGGVVLAATVLLLRGLLLRAMHGERPCHPTLRVRTAVPRTSCTQGTLTTRLRGDHQVQSTRECVPPLRHCAADTRDG